MTPHRAFLWVQFLGCVGALTVATVQLWEHPSLGWAALYGFAWAYQVRVVRDFEKR